MKNNLIYILFVILSAGCAGKNETTRLLESVNNGKSLAGIEKVLIIPGEGCPGCISDAADFCQTQIDSASMKNTMVVFTRVLDRKLLKLKFKKEFLNHSRVKVDTNNVLNKSDLVSSYPVVLFLEDGSFKDSKNFSKEDWATR